MQHVKIHPKFYFILSFLKRLTFLAELFLLVGLTFVYFILNISISSCKDKFRFHLNNFFFFFIQLIVYINISQKKQQNLQWCLNFWMTVGCISRCQTTPLEITIKKYRKIWYSLFLSLICQITLCLNRKMSDSFQRFPRGFPKMCSRIFRL